LNERIASFARGGEDRPSRYAAGASGSDYSYDKPKNLYTGKTYNNADAIAEFFKKKNIEPQRHRGTEEGSKVAEKKPLSGFEKLRSQASDRSKTRNPKPQIESGFIPGSHVKHEKYGKGLVLRREGSGDNVKLTISFPGFGQKKLIEKYANLEKA